MVGVVPMILITFITSDYCISVINKGKALCVLISVKGSNA